MRPQSPPLPPPLPFSSPKSTHTHTHSLCQTGPDAPLSLFLLQAQRRHPVAPTLVEYQPFWPQEQVDCGSEASVAPLSTTVCLTLLHCLSVNAIKPVLHLFRCSMSPSAMFFSLALCNQLVRRGEHRYVVPRPTLSPPLPHVLLCV